MRVARPRWAWLILLALAPAWLPARGRASAKVERFALIVGNDRGQPGEVDLQYAQSDARKVHSTLQEIGGFQPFNMLLLEDSSADAVRRSLIDLNDRVRAIRSGEGAQVVLFVYYSGHADARDLHLGHLRFSIAELSQLVRGSAADFRLLVLDACRSGSLTRPKGGRQTQPFDIPPQIELSGEGLAFLTASADNELAQESDEVRGSICSRLPRCIHPVYTHAVVRFPENLAECTGFQWDSGNSDKNWELHRVSMAEAEQVFFNRPILVALDAKHSQRELPYAALGHTNEGRRLMIVFTVRETLVRVISARDQSREERRVYEQAETKK